jgi:hypothetical protein
VRRWVHEEKRRYYQVHLVEDLFGEWTLISCWGGLDSHRGGMRTTGVESYASGLEQIRGIEKRRKQRGYSG